MSEGTQRPGRSERNGTLTGRDGKVSAKQEQVTWDGVSCVYNAQRNFTAGSRHSS